MFVKPGEGAVEGAAPVNNNGGIATNAREGPTNLFLETSTNVTKERSPITWALERTTCRVPTDGGRSSGPGSGEAPRPTSLLGQRPAPSGSADERTREGRPFAGGRECAPCSRGRRPPAWLRPEGLPRSGSGSSSVGGERARPAAPTGRPDPELQRPRRARRSAPPGVAPRGRGRPQPHGPRPHGPRCGA